MGKLFALGKMTTKNDFLDKDEIEILGEEFGIDIDIIDVLNDHREIDVKVMREVLDENISVAKGLEENFSHTFEHV